jgi:hypothetical protein
MWLYWHFHCPAAVGLQSTPLDQCSAATVKIDAISQTRLALATPPGFLSSTPCALATHGFAACKLLIHLPGLLLDFSLPLPGPTPLHCRSFSYEVTLGCCIACRCKYPSLFTPVCRLRGITFVSNPQRSHRHPLKPLPFDIRSLAACQKCNTRRRPRLGQPHTQRSRIP